MPVYARTRKFPKELRVGLQPRASTLCVECVCFHSVPRMRPICPATWTTSDFEGMFEDTTRMRTSLVSAQGMKTPFEARCCDSGFDEHPHSSGSADEYNVEGYNERRRLYCQRLYCRGLYCRGLYLQVIPTDLANMQWLSGQCMPALESSRKKTSIRSHEPQPFVSNAYVSTRYPE